MSASISWRPPHSARPGQRRSAARLLGAGFAAGLCAIPVARAATPAPATPIKHIIIIMQENRTFDSYFGKFPGADGIPAGTCVPLDPKKTLKGCVKPFHDAHDVNAGGPHRALDAVADLDDGESAALLDGFVNSQTVAAVKSNCGAGSTNPSCSGNVDGSARHDVMGYHDDDDIPNYYAYARHFVLQDRLFEGVRGWSLASHLDLVSEWSAQCTNQTDASTCSTSPTPPRGGTTTEYPWASLFELFDKNGVSWKYYLGQGNEPDCEDDEMTCAPVAMQQAVQSIWNPAPAFGWVKAQGASYAATHIVAVDQLVLDAENDTLPQVSWIVPNAERSEHPPAGITAGMEYVTSLVNAVMSSPAWNSTAIFITWDDWGGFYDHAVPPVIDTNASSTPVQGFGLRVPGIMISPYARAGLIDHQLLSFNSFATFAEDLFMGGKRLVPADLGTPDRRPTIRDALTSAKFIDGHVEPIGDLRNEFDFTQAPLQPLLLSTHIPIGLTAVCSTDGTDKCSTPTVTLGWQAVGTPQVPGPFTYDVQRDGVDLGQCVTTGTACTDAPGRGQHLYRIYSVDPNGVRSPLSAAAEADEP